MKWTRIIASVTNPYERKARLYPVPLALLPVLGICIAVYGLAGELEESLATLATTFGGCLCLRKLRMGGVF